MRDSSITNKERLQHILVVWETAKNDLPELKQIIETILGNEF